MAFAIIESNERKRGNPMLFGRKRMGDKFRLSKPPVVLERGDHVAHFANSCQLDAGANDTDSLAGVGEHLAPGIDDQRMTVAPPSCGVLTPLRRGKHKAAVLDCPRA